jgi:hypothetical protein
MIGFAIIMVMNHDESPLISWISMEIHWRFM